MAVKHREQDDAPPPLPLPRGVDGPSTLKTQRATKNPPGRPRKAETVQMNVRVEPHIQDQYDADRGGLSRGDYLKTLMARGSSRSLKPPQREAAIGHTAHMDVWLPETMIEPIMRRATENDEPVSALLARALMRGGRVEALEAEVARLKAELAKR